MVIKSKRRILLMLDPRKISVDAPPAPIPSPHYVLRVRGNLDMDNYTPALYYMFIPTTDVWARVTRRTDILGSAVGNQPIFVLGFTEWTTDQAYYGDWWRTAGIALWTGGGSVPCSGNGWNMSSTGTGGPTGSFGTPSSDGHEIYDMRATAVGISALGGGRFRSAINAEGWHNNVKEDALSLNFDGDTGKPGFSGFNSLVIFNRYAESGSLFLDDIKVGTNRGAEDLMSIQTFDDNTFGDFTVDPGEMTEMVDSFSLHHVGS